MALIRWDDEEDKDEELNNPIKTITSVQSGSWQPAPSGANAPAMDGDEPKINNGIFDQPTAQPQRMQNNYLMSEQKAQVDAQKRQRDIDAENARRAQAAAQAQAAQAMAYSRAQAQTRSQPQQSQTLDVDRIKKDTGWKKYYKDAFSREKAGMNFVDRLLDGGGASRRAEVIARNKYNAAMTRRAYDNAGRTIDPKAAMRARELTAYNSNIAANNSERAMADARAIGATYDNKSSGFLDRTKDTINAQRQIGLGSALFGVNDEQKKNGWDAARFAADMGFGLATAPTVAGKSLYEAAAGEGTDYSTGLEKELSAKERAGRGASGAIDAAGIFLGGSNTLLKSLSGKVASKTATQAEKALFKRVMAKYIIPTLVEGGEGAAQGAAEYFGNDGTLLDENGKLDMENLKEFGSQVGKSGLMGLGAGAVFTGAGAGIRRMRGKKPMPNIDVDLPPAQGEISPKFDESAPARERAPIEDGRVSELIPAKEGMTPAERAGERVGERIVETPTRDNAPDFITPETPITPDGRPTTTPEMTPVRDTPVEMKPSPIDGVKPVETPVIDTPPAKPMDTPVSDGRVRPTDVTVSDVDTPVTPTERTRQLQESKPGKSQAEEAAINQQLQELEASTPRIDGEELTPVSQSQQLQPVTPAKRDSNYSSANNITPVTRTQKVKDFGAKIKEKYGLKDESGYVKIPKKGDLTPVKTDSVPDGMGSAKDGVKTKAEKPLTEAQVAKNSRKNFANRMMTKTGDAKRVVQQVADAVGLSKDGGVDIDTLLSDAKIKPAQSKRIRDIHSQLETIFNRNTKVQKQNRKNYIGEKDVDVAINKERNRDTRDASFLEKKLNSELRQLARKGSIGEKAVQAFEDVTRARLANMLSSTGNVSRNFTQEIGANIIGAMKNPIKTARGMTGNGNLLGSALKNARNDWKVAPKTISEGYNYILGNVYNTAMTPVTAGANARRGALRTELTQWAMKNIEGKDISISDAQKLSKTLGNQTETLVNTLAGVDNGMVSSRQATKALKAWKEFVKNGDAASLTAFEKTISHQSTLAKKMLDGVFEGNTKGSRTINAMLSNVFPFVRTAWNLAETGVARNLNPLSKSVLDGIRADQRGGVANAGKIISNKIVDYGILTGAAMLVNDGLIEYNDGDEIDKPRGISIKVGEDTYVPIRATPIELPLAVTVAAARIAKDSANGDTRSPGYYGKIIGDSLPYINQFEQTTGAIESVANLGGKDGDAGYAAKAYGVNTGKSFVPWSNNGIQPQVSALKGESLNAKTSYDKDPAQWFKNTVKKSYSPSFYNSLPDSRDASGRVRTVDNQGIIIKKNINDKSTAEFNTKISDLVNFGRKNGLGKETKDMFNTYPDGKNNNFKSAQDVITFLDVKDGDKPDNKDKLKKNDKLADLAQQQRNGFYGDTGSELLTLDGQNLWSDVSMPNSNKTKNSNKPLSMESIRNAIAATDLPEKDRDAINAVWEQGQAKYKQVESGSMSYGQYKEQMAKLEKDVYLPILNKSANYKKMKGLFDKLDGSGFFDKGGLGSTKSGQTYLWNSLNALLGDKGKTPAADYPKDDKGFTPWGKRGGGGRKGSGFGATNKPGDRGNTGVKWTPVQRRQMAATASGKYTPVKIKVKLGNEIKKDKTQNYSDRSF